MTSENKDITNKRKSIDDRTNPDVNILLSKTIKDDYMFGAVMTEGDNCKILLEMILNRTLSNLSVREQHSIVNNPRYHSVRLDIIATDIEGIKYNVEMQTLREFTELRARYYHSQMDVELLKTGYKYKDLTETYVIFICDYDPLKLGKMMYTIENRCIEDLNYGYQDGLHTIFLNTKGKNREEINPELVKFLDYVRADLSESTMDFGSEYVRQLQSTIDKVRLNGERRDEYMKLEQMLQDEYWIGKNEGITQEKDLRVRKYLMMHNNPQEAAVLFEMPIDHVIAISKEVNHQCQ